jgi:hypothetical protein
VLIPDSLSSLKSFSLDTSAKAGLIGSGLRGLVLDRFLPDDAFRKRLKSVLFFAGATLLDSRFLKLPSDEAEPWRIPSRFGGDNERRVISVPAFDSGLIMTRLRSRFGGDNERRVRICFGGDNERRVRFRFAGDNERRVILVPVFESGRLEIRLLTGSDWLACGGPPLGVVEVLEYPVVAVPGLGWSLVKTVFAFDLCLSRLAGEAGLANIDLNPTLKLPVSLREEGVLLIESASAEVAAARSSHVGPLRSFCSVISFSPLSSGKKCRALRPTTSGDLGLTLVAALGDLICSLLEVVASMDCPLSRGRRGLGPTTSGDLEITLVAVLGDPICSLLEVVLPRE